jgi:predicted dehydrogenase
MAATLQQARDMLAAYQKLSPKPVWLVGENYRFEQAFQEAHDIKPQLGKLLKVDYVADMGMRSGNAYAALLT